MAATNVQAFSGDVEVASNLAVDTNVLFVDSVNNKVGIGVTNPGGLLDIRAASKDPSIPTVHIGDDEQDFGDYGMVNLVRNASSGGSKCHAAFIRYGQTVFGMGYYNNTSDFAFWKGFGDVTQTPAMIFQTTTGNVGIGTTNPKTGGLNVRGSFLAQGVNSTSFSHNLYYNGGWKYASADYGGAYMRMVDSQVQFWNAPNSGAEDAEATVSQRMTIDVNGNVGIGVANPTYNLDVQGSTAYDGSTTLRVLNPANAYGRNQLHLVGRYQLDNDAWSAEGPRNAIMFKTQSSLGSIITNRWTIQSFPQGTNNNLGFLAGTSDTPRVVFQGSTGRVGIGTTGPTAILDVRGTVNKTFFDGYYFGETTGTTTLTTRTRYVGIYADGDIMTDALFLASSDRRIKKDIIDVNDSEALDTLRLLKPKTYKYKDTNTRGTETVFGFIAQDVSNVISNSTRLVEETIPNIYELADVSDSNVITFTNFNTSDLEANTNTIQIMDINGTTHDATITSVIDEHTIRVAENLNNWSGSVDAYGNVITETTTTTLSVEEYEALESKDGYVPTISGYQSANGMISVEEYEALGDTTGYTEVVENYTRTMTTYPGNKLFVYGQRVTDFHSLNKNAIWTVATAALQEVDRQLQAEKVRNDALEARILALESA